MLYFCQNEISVILSHFISLANCANRPNEEFAIDLSRCQNTCELYGRKWQCPSYYKPRGDCYCKDGYARITEGGECVSVKENADCVAQLPVQKGEF